MNSRKIEISMQKMFSLRQNSFFPPIGKNSQKCFAFLVIFIFTCFILLFLFRCNINECGYVSNFNEIPGIQNERIFDDRIIVENDLFFYRTGFLSNFDLYIIGKFPSEIMPVFFDNPSNLGLPLPLISYQEQVSINAFSWPLGNIPTDITDKLKLHRENHLYYSNINDNLVLFEFCHENFYIKIYLLGKNGYFIISVTHYTR